MKCLLAHPSGSTAVPEDPPMHCPRCGFENPEGLKFCGECGTAVTAPCPTCGSADLPRFQFCGDGGAREASPSRTAPPRCPLSPRPPGRSAPRDALRRAAAPAAADHAGHRRGGLRRLPRQRGRGTSSDIGSADGAAKPTPDVAHGSPRPPQAGGGFPAAAPTGCPARRHCLSPLSA
jgi:hypothetical protein